MDRQTVSTGTSWEEDVGYSRAVRVGDRIEVSGTTGTVDGAITVPDDPGEQARRAFENVASALEEAVAVVGRLAPAEPNVFGTDVSTVAS